MKENLRLLFLKKEHHFSKEQLSKIGKPELKEVQTIFKTTEDHGEYKKSMDILLQLDGANTKKTLQKIVLDNGVSDVKRIYALNALNSVSNVKDEPNYLKALENKATPVDVQRKMIEALGKFGSVKSLKALEQKQHENGLSQEAQLSILLIKGRNKLKSDFVFDVTPTPVTRKVVREKRSPMKARKVAFEIPETYGMKLDNTGYAIQCGAAMLTFVMNAEFNIKETTKTQLAGLITAEYSEPKQAYTKFVIVVDRNRRGQTQVLVFRKDGLLSYGGIVQPDGSFVVECTRKTGSDLARIHGQVEGGKLKFTSHETAKQRIYTRQTAKSLV